MAGYIGSQTPVVSNGSQRKYTFTATAAQTVFTGMDIPNPQQIQVFQNGVRLVITTDYTVSSGTTVTLVNAASAGDSLVVILFADYQLLDQDLSGDFSVDSPTFVVDSTNNRVGIGTSLPTSTASAGPTLEISGTAGGNLVLSDSNATTGQRAKYFLSQGGTLYIGHSADNGTSPVNDLVVDSSGKAGIGTTSPSSYYANQLVVDTGSALQSGITIVSDTGNQSMFAFADGTSGDQRYRGFLDYNHSNDVLSFGTAGGERMRIDSPGNVGIGTSSVNKSSSSTALTVNTGTAANYSALELSSGDTLNWHINANNSDVYDVTAGSRNRIFYTNGSERMRISSGGTVNIGTTAASGASGNTGIGMTQIGRTISNCDTDWNYEIYGAQTGRLRFFSSAGGGTQVGSVTVSTSSTSYNTSSDHRLKENVADVTDGIARVKQLEPKRFNFIADPDTTVDGFLAHQAQTVVPEAVTGTHNEVDDDGNAVMQGIDQSKLVPLLTAALKEAITKIETLEARLDALEGN